MPVRRNMRLPRERSSIEVVAKIPFSRTHDLKRGSNGQQGRDTHRIHSSRGEQDREQIFDIFRRWGYLQATLDPLGQYLPPEPFPIATTPEGDIAAEARRYLLRQLRRRVHAHPQPRAAPVAAGADGAPRAQARPGTHPHRTHPRRPLRAGHPARYLGTKRFSLEGLTVLIPFLDQVLASSLRRSASHAPSSPWRIAAASTS